MKTFNDLKVGDKIYGWYDGKCSIGLIKEIEKTFLYISFFASPIIGDVTKYYISRTDHYRSMNTAYSDGKIFADEEKFLKYIEAKELLKCVNENI